MNIQVPSQVYGHTASSKSSLWTYSKFQVKFMDIQQVPSQVHEQTTISSQVKFMNK